ncbi:odorant receptor 82a-like [Megachile rotundata]|uniref:odorant receptor 82a-like n=1 Tax=Megachile rotundata TaxID=143995 RepID=UPI003FCF7685
MVISLTVAMKSKETKIKDVLLLNERIFSICDAWPLNNSYKKFVVYMTYLSVHMVMMNLDLYDVMGNLELMVENILSNTVITTTYMMLFLLRFSKLIKSAIAMMKRELAEDDFRNNEERHLYLFYNVISSTYGKYVVKSTTFMVVLLYYFVPLAKLLKSSSGDGNSSMIYELPVRFRPFLNYEESLRNYILMYLYQFPVVWVGLFHTTTASLILNLALHVCGKFSILSYRIQNIVEDSEKSFQVKVKELVRRHVELIAVANTINSALQYILALELLQSSIRVAVSLYTILMLRDDQIFELCTFVMYTSIIMLMLYIYSFIGEQLQTESIKVNDAYYEANWLKLSTRGQKLLLQCMCNGRRTLNLTAAKFYSFSLFGFISIMKTCFGFVSLLRAVI